MILDMADIETFCKKQGMDERDKQVQFQCIAEEINELEYAGLYETKERELQEVVDVLVTVLVYCKIIGMDWKSVKREFIRKMEINNRKPIREKSGVKVKKC